jgi:hypothetical protein
MGTSMSLRLNETLSTETNRVGDSFTATLQNAITDADGHVIVPAGATVRGRLTQVEKSGHVGATGIIKLAFEAVSFGGRSYPMDATVVRANPQRQNRTTTQEQAAKVAAGAAAGAVLGRVLGKDTRSTLKGAASARRPERPSPWGRLTWTWCCRPARTWWSGWIRPSRSGAPSPDQQHAGVGGCARNERQAGEWLPGLPLL